MDDLARWPKSPAPAPRPASVPAPKAPEAVKPIPPSAPIAASAAIIAGRIGAEGDADGAGAEARFRWPRGIAVDSAGNLYVADSGNRTIRKITPDHTVSTLAGLATNAGTMDGKGSAARFMAPQGITADAAGNVYVADFADNTIRRITPDGVVSLLAGLTRAPGRQNGRGAQAQFANPWSVAVDAAGNVYVSDNGNLSLRKISADEHVITVADSFGNPRGVAVDAAGNVYVADLANNAIRKIAPGGKVSVFFGGLSNPENVTVDGRGFVYVTDEAGIHRISPDGKAATLLPPLPLTGAADGPTARAEAIAVDAAGHISIADVEHNVICRGNGCPLTLVLLPSAIGWPHGFLQPATSRKLTQRDAPLGSATWTTRRLGMIQIKSWCGTNNRSPFAIIRQKASNALRLDKFLELFNAHDWIMPSSPGRVNSAAASGSVII